MEITVGAVAITHERMTSFTAVAGIIDRTGGHEIVINSVLPLGESVVLAIGISKSLVIIEI